ncbi:helix-turn-helix domain-containing protein [Amycolatopsis taiwanensis]|uniref:helix-turn-helix domain-containing protein n=3 Tax=Amycolatopsis taiwanensis TaxID=342230 RepID=UPI0004805CC5|nr:helix-turn-helix transcriptional regulator [Amycolatopsis taiwanensis]
MTDFQARREAFGNRLRALREEHRVLSGREMAKRLAWPQSRVSKIETGKQTPDHSDVIAWCDALDAPEAAQDLLAELEQLRLQQVEWRRQLRSGHRQKQLELDQRQQNAKVIRAVDIAAVPGLAQTPPYARRIFIRAADLLAVPQDADQAVAARMARQQILYQGSKTIEILVAEAALSHPIAPPDEMIVQIDRLISLVGMPHVRFGILPLFRALPHVVPHGYWIVDDRVAVETVTSELEIDDPEQVAIYHRMTDRLWKAAAEGEQAIDILRRLAEEYRRQR